MMKKLLLGSLLTAALVFTLVGADKSTTKGTAAPKKNAAPKGKKHRKKGDSGSTTPPPK